MNYFLKIVIKFDKIKIVYEYPKEIHQKINTNESPIKVVDKSEKKDKKEKKVKKKEKEDSDEELDEEQLKKLEEIRRKREEFAYLEKLKKELEQTNE